MPIATTMPVPTNLGVHAIIDLFRNPNPDQTLISSHRGLRWNGIPENSKASIRQAVQFGLLSVEIDIRVTADGHPVALHDDHLGRITNVAEHKGRSDVYSPFTGQGYNPRVDSLNWKDDLELLKLKNENGQICDEGILDVVSMIAFIEEEDLDVVVFLDVKDQAAIEATYQILKTRKNGKGVPALEWCVWKLDSGFYPTAEALEASSWFSEALSIGRPVYIPVFEPSTARGDIVEAGKSFISRPYVIAIEVGMRASGGKLHDLAEYVTKEGVSMGFFGALGDVHPPPTPEAQQEMKFDLGEFDIDAHREPGKESPFQENRLPASYHSLLLPGESLDGRDYRSNLPLFKKLGYRWIIADLTRVSAPAFMDHAQIRQPINKDLRDARLSFFTQQSEL